MMNNIAVILRGHMRTWDYVHPVVFDFYKKIAHNVDYYISTWQYPNQGFQWIFDSFQKYNQNIVTLLPVTIDSLIYTSYKGPSYLTYSILPYTRKRHKEVNYEFVFNTRPDIIYRVKPDCVVPALNENTWYTSNYVCQQDNEGAYRIGVEDHIFAGTYEVNATMNTRHIYHDVIGCHNAIKKYADDENFYTASMYWMDAHIVRPNAFELVPNPFEYFDYPYHTLHVKWMDLPKEEKLQLLQKYNIAPDDYITNSILAKL